MKDDAPTPEVVPRKRRQIEAVPALWLAEWLARDDLSPGDRKRVQGEKDRRRNLNPDNRVGILVGVEGMTPEQFATFKDMIGTVGATEIHHPGVASKVHGMCKSLGVPVNVHHQQVSDSFTANRDVVKSSDVVIATPKTTAPNGGGSPTVWDHIKYAKHRSVPVKIIMPDGGQG